MTRLTEDHLLLLEVRRSGSRYRQCLKEMKNRELSAARQQEMWDEIADVISRCVEPTESTIQQLLKK